MYINDMKVNENSFAYDGCHKIYIIEDEDDIRSAVACGYMIHNILELPGIYYSSCPLRFIHNWKLTKTYVSQDDNNNVVFE